MKLYMHPVSTACRPVRLLIAENGITCDEQTVDILQGAHYQEPYASLNPNRMVPWLEDGDFRLTEGSAILKYLADKYDLPSYPTDLKKRAKVNEVMDWLNTHDALDLDAEAVVVGESGLEEAGGASLLLVGHDLGEGDAGVVVDGDMDELPAEPFAA